MYSGVGDGFAKIKASQGLGGFTLGWLPTLVGYSAQGFGKFGFYEIFKDLSCSIVGQETFSNNRKVFLNVFLLGNLG